MGFFNGVWSSLKFSSGSAIMSAAGNVGWHYKAGIDGTYRFKNNRAYKVIGIQVAKQMAMQMMEAEINKLFPRYQKYLEKQLRDTVLKQQESKMKDLITNQRVQNSEWGRVYGDGHTYVAKDKFGTPVPEALMLYYDLKEPITVEDVEWRGEESYEVERRGFWSEMVSSHNTIKHKAAMRFGVTHQTKTLCHIDLSPQISLQTQKNIVMTKVQGRDYSRKELISGGDLTFTINGKVVSDQLNLYPDVAVQKLIQMVQYPGIINVNHHLFRQCGIDKVIITDFGLSQQEYINEQPYTMTVVAVEPDEEVVVKKDTIGTLETEIQLSPMNQWYKFILNNKLAEMSANVIAGAATSALGGAMDLIPAMENENI